tara:strand:- start:134 stop:328 length:195 start_codon:yes stop_codon:yes gene_type:complete
MDIRAKTRNRDSDEPVFLKFLSFIFPPAGHSHEKPGSALHLDWQRWQKECDNRPISSGFSHILE